MSEAKKVQRNFKPWDDNQERLVYAEKIGVNPGDVINESLRRVARKVIEDKAKQLREALSVPIP